MVKFMFFSYGDFGIFSSNLLYFSDYFYLLFNSLKNFYNKISSLRISLAILSTNLLSFFLLSVSISVIFLLKLQVLFTRQHTFYPTQII